MDNRLVCGLHKPVIAMVHVDALPGTPKYNGCIAQIIDKAVEEAMCYEECGVDAIALENMHDIPYLNQHVGPEITAAMSVVAREVKKNTYIPCGLQILAGANKEALSVALAADLQFIRAEGFVFGHLADEGYIDSCAAELLRFRKMIGAEHIQIFTDIKKKHSSHAISSDVDICETAHAAEFFLSDGLIVTGVATGSQADALEISQVKESVSLPVLVGSGVTAENVEAYLKSSDAMIVGSYFKKDGFWVNEVEPLRVQKFMEAVKRYR